MSRHIYEVRARKNPLDYVSVVGQHLIQPVIDFVEKLESLPPAEENEVQSGGKDNGYSCAMIVLSALVLESALNRTRYVRHDASNTSHVTEYFRIICGDEDLAADVNEVFAIRDAIVHNHLWKAKIDPVAMKFISRPELLPGYGRKRFQDVMDPETRLSRKLKVNLFPSRICRSDAYVVFKTMAHALTALDEIDPTYFPVGPKSFVFQHELVSLSEVLNALFG